MYFKIIRKSTYQDKVVNHQKAKTDLSLCLSRKNRRRKTIAQPTRPVFAYNIKHYERRIGMQEISQQKDIYYYSLCSAMLLEKRSNMRERTFDLSE